MTTMTVDSYIAARPPRVQVRLLAIRATIHRIVPEVTERISYAMPAFSLDGRPILFVAAWKRHLAIYPIPPRRRRAPPTHRPPPRRQRHAPVSAQRAPRP
jgi:uncharacterized protein YdhG (YjbR/CyaY superfamily)